MKFTKETSYFLGQYRYNIISIPGVENKRPCLHYCVLNYKDVFGVLDGGRYFGGSKAAVFYSSVA